jgi:hypothetical protein
MVPMSTDRSQVTKESNRRELPSEIKSGDPVFAKDPRIGSKLRQVRTFAESSPNFVVEAFRRTLC